MPTHRSSKSFLVEGRNGSRGSRVRKPAIKEFTPKLRAEHNNICVRRCKLDEPLDQLPPHYLVYPKTPCYKTPCFHFGIGITFQQLYDYAFQHRLVPEGYRSNPWLNLDVIHATAKHLDRISGANLYLKPVLHAQYDWVVARYSNYTWYHEEAQDWQENMVMDLIRRELNIDDTPRWHPSAAP